MKDVSPQMRVQAIRASESLTKAGDKTLEADVRERVKDGDANVVIQALLTLNLQKVPDIAKLVEGAQATSKARGVKELGDQMLRPPQFTAGAAASADGARAGRDAEEGRRHLHRAVLLVPRPGRQRRAARRRAGRDDDGAAAGGSPRVHAHKDYVIKTVLHGLTGPVDGSPTRT
jgi:hypothetical protein